MYLSFNKAPDVSHVWRTRASPPHGNVNGNEEVTGLIPIWPTCAPNRVKPASCTAPFGPTTSRENGPTTLYCGKDVILS